MLVFLKVSDHGSLLQFGESSKEGALTKLKRLKNKDNSDIAKRYLSYPDILQILKN